MGDPHTDTGDSGEGGQGERGKSVHFRVRRAGFPSQLAIY